MKAVFVTKKDFYRPKEWDRLSKGGDKVLVIDDGEYIYSLEYINSHNFKGTPVEIARQCLNEFKRLNG